MFEIDDRTGNAVTTVALFLIAASVLYLARGAFFVLVLSLLFGYLLEPAVTLVQRHLQQGKNNRTWLLLCCGLCGWNVFPGRARRLRSPISHSLK